MSGWSTFFTVTGILSLILIVPSFIFVNAGVSIALLVSTLSCFCASSLFDGVIRIEKNTQQILDQLKKSE